MEEALGSSAGRQACLIPVVVQGKAVAALYSDAVAGSEAMSGLEILARVAGLRIETVAARTAAVGEAPRPAPPVEAEVPSVVGPVQGETAVEEVRPHEVSPELAPLPPEEIGAPVAESLAASNTAVGEASALAPPPDMGSLPEEARESHRKAHRFARVAVQDLLSYHNDKIAEGRRNRNLFALLRNDIEKTRENYQKRFGSTPARSFDYLHYEMVSKLAQNDPSALGDQYPGAWAGEE
jgi:hypothetical protein